MLNRCLFSNLLCKRNCLKRSEYFKLIRCYTEQQVISKIPHNKTTLEDSNLVGEKSDSIFNQPKRINRRKRPLTAAYPCTTTVKI